MSTSSSVETQQTIKVRALFFAQFREELGERSAIWEVQRGTTPADLLDDLSGRSPRIAGLRGVVRVMVNGEFAEMSVPLEDGDELAFIPPVAGGSGCT